MGKRLLISHGKQRQPTRRGGRPDQGTIPIVYRTLHQAEIDLSATDCQQRAHDRSHHVTKETVSADCCFDELTSPTCIPAPTDRKTCNCSGLSLSIRLGGGKASPVMQTQKQLRALTHELKIESTCLVLSIAKSEGRHYRAFYFTVTKIISQLLVSCMII